MIFFVRVESRWLEDETLNLFVIRAFEHERFQRLHIDLRQQRVVHVRDGFRGLLWLTTENIEPVNFGGSVNRCSAEENRVCSECYVIAVKLCDFLWCIFVFEILDENRSIALVFGRKKDWGEVIISKRRRQSPRHRKAPNRSIKLLRQIARLS